MSFPNKLLPVIGWNIFNLPLIEGKVHVIKNFMKLSGNRP